jgi:hypothetical protein
VSVEDKEGCKKGAPCDHVSLPSTPDCIDYWVEITMSLLALRQLKLRSQVQTLVGPELCSSIYLTKKLPDLCLCTSPIFFFSVVGLKLRAFTLSHSTSPIFVKGFLR